jgi:Kef-type K+ transport system membrane component KefB
MNIFVELSLILALTTLVSCIMKLFKQPLVVGYILTGIIIGPYFLDIFHSVEHIEVFSKIGIAILLFVIGLSLNPKVIKEVGTTAVVTGVGQVLFTSVIGYFIARVVGYGTTEAIYIAIALTFSSTIIILKLLSDKGELNKLYGKVTMGLLLIQDIIATIVLLVVSALASSQGISMFELASGLFIKGITTIAILVLISHYVIPRISNFIASSQELLFLFSLAWGLGLASIFAVVGFSIEIGALVAGVALSMSPFAYEMASRLKPLRDFFVVLFFILLGAQMIFSDLGAIILPAIILSLFVLIGKPLIELVLMNLLGYKRKVGFMAGVTIAQISEFSLILAALALTIGHISREVVSLITLVGIITIACSTYLIMYADKIYHSLDGVLKHLDVKSRSKRRATHTETFDAIIFGYDRVGIDFVKAVEKLHKNYLVVDFDPQSIHRLQEEKIPHRFGDAEDIEFLQELELAHTKLVISTIPDFKISMLLVRTYRKANPSGIIMVISHSIEHARELYLEGASYVVMPHYLGAHHAAQMITRHGLDIEEFERERNLHLAKLAKRH